MSDTDHPGAKKMILKRRRIQKSNTPAKEYKLPSGNAVSINYLTLDQVREIHKYIDSATEDDIEQTFTEEVVKRMLRENNVNDLVSFSEEDQIRLIEIAAEEWGCIEEYNALNDIGNPEIRFFQAVRQQERELEQQLSESISRLSANTSSSILPMKTLQDEWASSFKGVADYLSITEQVSEAFKDLSKRAVDQLSEISKLSVPIANLTRGFSTLGSSLQMPFESMLLAEVGEIKSSYLNLMKDLYPIEKFMVLPEVIRYYPTIEMCNTSVVAGQLLMGGDYEAEEEVITPDANELITWLGELDPSFPMMLAGANQAIYSNNPDRCRHFASSHRELCTHILHILAPDMSVKMWTNDPNHFYDGKPTRKARLLYIARNYKNLPFSEFFVKDFSNQMDLLNTDEHRKRHEYNENELFLLHKRFLSALGFLKEIIGYHKVDQ